MSAQEIIAELPKLKPDEFRLVQEKVDDLAKVKNRLHAERIAGRLILAGPRIVRQTEVEAILDEFPRPGCSTFPPSSPTSCRATSTIPA